MVVPPKYHNIPHHICLGCILNRAGKNIHANKVGIPLRLKKIGEKRITRSDSGEDLGER
jgi:hypothetical protein